MSFDAARAYSADHQADYEESTPSGYRLPQYRGGPGGQGKPKNGEYYVTLLAGASPDFARNVRTKLARKGVYAKYHWDDSKEAHWRREVPKDVDFVIVVKDGVSHKLCVPFVARCRRAGIRWITTQSKVATLFGALANHKIRTGAPLNSSVMIFNEDLRTESEPEAAEETVQTEDTEIPQTELLYARENSVEVQPPAVNEPVALSTVGRALDPVNPIPAVNVIIQTALSPVPLPEPSKGSPSPQVMALSSILFRMCRDEGVSVICTPKDITFSAA